MKMRDGLEFLNGLVPPNTKGSNAKQFEEPESTTLNCWPLQKSEPFEYIWPEKIFKNKDRSVFILIIIIYFE